MNRILHVDGDSFFASCEIALNEKLQGRPVWVGGGRRGDGIVIAANRVAKKFGVETGMACFEAKRICPQGVLCRPHYDEYRKQGLPLMSSHVESTVKQINYRVKGTEKFWTEEGAEALLQLRADYISDDEPLEGFWQRRQMAATGQRPYRRHSA